MNGYTETVFIFFMGVVIGFICSKKIFTLTINIIKNDTERES